MQREIVKNPLRPHTAAFLLPPFLSRLIDAAMSHMNLTQITNQGIYGTTLYIVCMCNLKKHRKRERGEVPKSRWHKSHTALIKNMLIVQARQIE